MVGGRACSQRSCDSYFWGHLGWPLPGSRWSCRRPPLVGCTPGSPSNRWRWLQAEVATRRTLATTGNRLEHLPKRWSSSLLHLGRVPHIIRTPQCLTFGCCSSSSFARHTFDWRGASSFRPGFRHWNVLKKGSDLSWRRPGFCEITCCDPSQFAVWAARGVYIARDVFVGGISQGSGCYASSCSLGGARTGVRLAR